MLKKLLIVATSLSAFSLPTFAQSTSGAYVGGTYSNASLKSEELPGVSVDLATVGGILGYQLNENFALEARYATGAKDGSLLNAATVKVDSYTGANLVGMLPLSNGFSAYGTLGYGSLKLKISGNGGSESISESSVSYGGGLQYRTGQFTFRGGFESLYDKDNETVRGFTLTGLYHF